DQRVVAAPGGAGDEGLVRERDAAPDPDGVRRGLRALRRVALDIGRDQVAVRQEEAIARLRVPLALVALDRLDGVDAGAVLDVRVVAYVDVLALVPAEEAVRADEDALAALDAADDLG